MREWEPWEVGWVAGIIEGEGCIRRDRCCVTVEMTDRDVIERLASLWDCPIREWHRKRPDRMLQPWAVSVSGPKAEAILRRVLPYLCGRRGERVREVLSLTSTGRRRGDSSPTSEPEGTSLRMPSQDESWLQTTLRLVLLSRLSAK